MIIFFLKECLLVAAQESNPSELSIEQLAEHEQFISDDDGDIQQYQYLLKNPLDLNRASAEELHVFSFLHEIHIMYLLKHRSIHGDLISIYELQAIPYWDETIIRLILPYVYIGNASLRRKEWKERWTHGDQIILAGTTMSCSNDPMKQKEMLRYPGGPERVFVRYKYQYKNLLQYGVLAEKDPGEAWFKGVQQKGFDFYSAHMVLRNLGKFKTIVLGDYHINLGQGLLIWQSMAFRKSSEPMLIKRQGAILRPYHSSGEFAFHRGVGITTGYRSWSLTGFASSRNYSSIIYSDTIDNRNYFSSINASGLHRTISEQQAKGALRCITSGGNLSFDRSNFHVGLNLIGHDFGLVWQQKQDKLYNLFAFGGNQYTNISLDASYTYKNLHLFSEWVMHRFRSSAMLAGMMISLDQRVDMSLLVRDMSRGYQSHFGNAFTESTFPSNEKGAYAGLSIRPRHGWRVDLYADLYQFPWLRYRVDAPSHGRDYMCQVSYSVRRRAQLYLRIRDEEKLYNDPMSGLNLKDGLVAARKISWRAQMEWQYNRSWMIRNRVEVLALRQGHGMRQSGFICFLDAFYKPMMKPYSLNVRFQYFEADSYDSRVYAYENDVLYQFSVPAFYGNGYRAYLNGKIVLSKSIRFWFRLSRTWTGYIKETEVKGQIQWLLAGKT